MIQQGKQDLIRYRLSRSKETIIEPLGGGYSEANKL